MDYDVVIIGGGIHGVGVAQAAAVRGYKTLLIEQYAKLAEGTSSRSSKLIHGGLRYLEQLQIGLVRECLRERSYLLKNAPNLVRLTPVHIPVYRHSKRSPWVIRAGLSLYAVLGNLSADCRYKTIPKNQWHQLKKLNTKNLLAVFQYYEAQTDDRLLTQAVMDSAIEYGADLLLNTKANAVELQADQCIVTIRNDSGETRTLNSKTVVNAAGPWASTVLDQVYPKQNGIPVDLVQGAHIVLPCNLGNMIYYLESPDDQRPLFIMPWYGDTLVGTTENLFTKDPACTVPLKEEVDYLFKAFCFYFPSYNQNNLIIKHQFSGLRVLPDSHKKANQRSRETIYLRDRRNKPRLLSIFGGKLTAYRATAEQAINYLQESLPEKKAQLDTKYIKLNR